MSLLDAGYALIAPQGRSIGTIIPDCTFEEHHVDRVAVTEHPVMRGASVTDHAYCFPPDLVVRIGFSNSTARVEGWKQQAYAMLLAMKNARQPFDVSTGSRPYQNMLITQLETTTDETSEWVLNITVTMRNLNLVNAQTTAASNGSIASSPTDQAIPQTTAAPINGGTVQPVPADGSLTFEQSQAVQGGSLSFDTIKGGAGFSVGGIDASTVDYGPTADLAGDSGAPLTVHGAGNTTVSDTPRMGT